MAKGAAYFYEEGRSCFLITVSPAAFVPKSPNPDTELKKWPARSWSSRCRSHREPSSTLMALFSTALSTELRRFRTESESAKVRIGMFTAKTSISCRWALW